MTSVVELKLRQRKPGKAWDAGTVAEIIMFPGVRIERLAGEPEKPAPEKPDGSSRGDRAVRTRAAK